jgi:hypothetical protein
MAQLRWNKATEADRLEQGRKMALGRAKKLAAKRKAAGANGSGQAQASKRKRRK